MLTEAGESKKPKGELAVSMIKNTCDVALLQLHVVNNAVTLMFCMFPNL